MPSHKTRSRINEHHTTLTGECQGETRHTHKSPRHENSPPPSVKFLSPLSLLSPEPTDPIIFTGQKPPPSRTPKLAPHSHIPSIIILSHITFTTTAHLCLNLLAKSTCQFHPDSLRHLSYPTGTRCKVFLGVQGLVIGRSLSKKN
jgi:hypothetical protein